MIKRLTLIKRRKLKKNLVKEVQVLLYDLKVLKNTIKPNGLALSRRLAKRKV